MILGYLFSNFQYAIANNIGSKTDKVKVIMILGYLFSCSLTFSMQSASNIGGKTDKDKGDHHTGYLFSCSLTLTVYNAESVSTEKVDARREALQASKTVTSFFIA
jgi:hypothetical protein